LVLVKDGKEARMRGVTRANSISTGKATLNCSHCYKVGHTCEKCLVLYGRPDGKTGAKDGKPPAEQEVSVAEVATTTRVGQNNINSNEWLWDSGATQAMTHSITLLHYVRPFKEPTRVKLGDGRYTFRQLAEKTCTAVLILMIKHWNCSFPKCCMYLNLVKTFYQPTQYFRMAIALLVTATVLSSGVITIRNLFSLVVLKALCILYLSLSSCHLQWKIGHT